MTFINNERFVNSGTAKVLCEMNCEIHPPMSRIIDERFDINITDCTVFADKVIIKGLVEVSLMYKHPHLKNKDNIKKELSKEDDRSSSDKANNKVKDVTEIMKKDYSNWHNRVRSIDGIIHFYEETIEFAGIIEVPGAVPGDNYHVEKLEVNEYEEFTPIKKDHNGLIIEGNQIFYIDAAIKITRNQDTYIQPQIFVQKNR